jgi:hypothetical protein
MAHCRDKEMGLKGGRQPKRGVQDGGRSEIVKWNITTVWSGKGETLGKSRKGAMEEWTSKAPNTAAETLPTGHLL